MRPPMRGGVCPEAVASAASAQRRMHKLVVKRVEDLVSTCVDCIVARRRSTQPGDLRLFEFLAHAPFTSERQSCRELSAKYLVTASAYPNHFSRSQRAECPPAPQARH